MSNVTLVSTDPQETVERVLQVEKPEEPTLGEVAEESAETSAESQTAPESTEHKPSKRSQKVKRLAEKLTEAERERDELRAKLQASGRVEQPAPKDQKEQFAYPVPKPKYEDFQKPEDFVEALTEWKADAREYERGRAAEAEAQQAVVQDHFNRVDEARERYSDFDEVVEAGGEVRFRDEASRNAFYAAVFEDESGPDVLYYLGKHPEAIDEFAEMSPGQVAAKVGRIAASIGQASSPPPKKAAPVRRITPVGGGSKQADVPDDRSKMPFREWQRLRRAGQIR